MKKGLWLASMLAAFLLAAGTVRAQTIDDKIKTLESELIQLKEAQVELKKEATAAAAAMPTFSFRPGNGLNIEAADKSWGFRTSLESHFRYTFQSGRDQVGRSQGEMLGRRFRPSFFYCLNNCLWEAEVSLDLDGWGTGNGKNNQGTGVGSILQRGAIKFAAEQLHPWLPTAQFGMEVSGAAGGSLARQGSGNVGAQAEYDLHSRNNGFNTGRAGSGVVLNWDDRSLASIGIPGRIGRLQFGMASFAEGDDGTQSLTDRKDFNTYLSIMPFSQVKSKWISGLTWEYGAWFCNADNRSTNGCSRYRVQDHGDGGRQTLFDSGADSIGDGLHVAHGPGLVWNVGPYTFRTMGHFQTSEDRGGTSGQKKAHSFLIGHDLYLWSPKGFLTGSPTEAGSILIGTHFERVDMSVGCNGSTGIDCRDTGSGGHFGNRAVAAVLAVPGNAGTAATPARAHQFHRNRILLREWDIVYVLAPRMNVALNVLWYDASNLRNGANQAAHNLGVCKTPNVTNATGCRNGIGGDWVDVFLNWRMQF